MKRFIEQAYKGATEWWKYLLGFLFIFFVWQLFAAIQPLVVFFELSDKGYSPEELLLKMSNFEILMSTLESNLNLLLLLLGFVGGFAAIIFVVRLFHNSKMKYVVTSRPKVDWGRVFFSFLFYGVLVVLSLFVSLYLSPNDYELNFNLNKFLVLAVIGILLIPIQTTFEEIYFRGYFLQGLGVITRSRAVALIVPSILFGLLHLGNPEVGKIGYQAMIAYVGTGFLLGIMTMMDEGLELAIGFHAANNLITALLVTADWTAFQTYSVYKYTGEPSLISDVYIPVFIVYPILIFIFAKKYKWNNWKERLFGKIESQSISQT